MSKLNIGDKVTLKACAKQGMGWTHGNEYVVTRVYQDEFGYNRIKTNIDDHGSNTNGWLAEYFEPIEAGPIRTVTRREIVEWKDDVLHVVPHEKDCVLVALVNSGDTTFKSLNSSQCREAAHILNQLAEVLEDV